MNESRRYEQDQRFRRNEERYDRNDRQGDQQYGQRSGQGQGDGQQYGQGYGQGHGQGQSYAQQYGQGHGQQPQYGQRSYEQDDRMGQQWRDQGDGRFGGSERRGDDRSWEWDHERSGRGQDGGYRAGERQGRMSGGGESDRWMDSSRQIGDRDSSRAWRGTGGGSYEGGGYQGGGYQGGGYQGGSQRSASQGGGFEGDPTEWGGSYAGGRYGGGSAGAGNRESFTGRGPKGYRRSDDRIREEVSDRLTDDHSLDASEIEVEVKDGEVTLKGTVPDRQQKRRAEDLAESCSGVSDVTNNIRVSRGDQPGQGRDSQSQSQSNQKSSQSGSQAGSQKTNSKGSSADASM